MAAAVLAGLALVGLLAVGLEPFAWGEARAQTDDGSGRWSTELAAFDSSDRQRPPRPGGIVFTGSSSIGLWHGLEGDFPHLNIVRRGLGGSTLADCTLLVDRLVLRYAPRLVVVYAGDNDLAQGATPETVLARYLAFTDRVRAVLPGTRVIFLSIKASPQRAALMPQVDRANALIAAASQGQARLIYVDIYHPMLDTQGRPDARLFQGDGLHPNDAGYAVWKAAVKSHLN